MQAFTKALACILSTELLLAANVIQDTQSQRYVYQFASTQPSTGNIGSLDGSQSCGGYTQPSSPQATIGTRMLLRSPDTSQRTHESFASSPSCLDRLHPSKQQKMCPTFVQPVLWCSTKTQKLKTGQNVARGYLRK